MNYSQKVFLKIFIGRPIRARYSKSVPEESFDRFPPLLLVFALPVLRLPIFSLFLFISSMKCKNVKYFSQFLSHVTRKREKERSVHMRNVISNIRSEKTKSFHVRVLRILSPSDFDRMDIS